MRLRNMLKICLVFSKSEPQYAYKRYAYKKTCATAKFVNDKDANTLNQTKKMSQNLVGWRDLKQQ